MFQSRYVSNISQRSYIRQRYSAFNIASTLNRTNDNTATDSNDHDIIDIYDEDEEMTPTIDTESAESEEVSEDDIAFKSEYERMMRSLMRATNMKVIEEFKKDDVVPNSRRFRKYRWRLPLLSIRSRKINISNKKMPSTSKDTGKAYYLSVTDIIHHILNNPSISDNMYFGPGQEVTKSKEFWHGNIWKELPRFGQASITIAQNIYYSGDFVIYRESKEAKRLGRILVIIQQDGQLKIKIQRILIFEDLPGNLQSNNRKQRSQEGELWFMD
ncbi:hypothetical protein RhiirA1_402387 [Rhizophagus irregularis]|uniref:Uncharacterized protein n=1 Tax=Rhizophagus irregularis TaxID=588596 RepID=A0A2N0QYF2_9GLOM|nr:hypothetical protein RhiirA1_402387 [Rhizophagus irregularis]